MPFWMRLRRARERAAHAHDHSAGLHEQAATMFDRLGRPDDATRHRLAAQVDRDAAIADRALNVPPAWCRRLPVSEADGLCLSLVLCLCSSGEAEESAQREREATECWDSLTRPQEIWALRKMGHFRIGQRPQAQQADHPRAARIYARIRAQRTPMEL